MESRKNSSSSTIDINSALGNRPSVNRARLPHAGPSDAVGPASGFVRCARKAATARRERLNFGLPPVSGERIYFWDGLWLNQRR